MKFERHLIRKQQTDDGHEIVDFEVPMGTTIYMNVTNFNETFLEVIVGYIPHGSDVYGAEQAFNALNELDD